MEAIMEKIDLKKLDKTDWQTYRFDEIAKSVSERVDPNNTDLEIYVGLEHLDSEDIHIRRKGTADDVNGQKLKCYPGDVIFGKRRAYQRKAAVVDFEGFCSAHALVLRANEEVIDPKLFPFFLHSDTFMHRAVDISVGSLSPTINWGTLKSEEFLLPPKEQQAQLAELLWAMDEVVEGNTRTKKTLGKLYKIASLKYLLGKERLTDEENEFIKTDLGLLPSNWKLVKYKDVAQLIHGYQFRDHDFTENGIPIVKIGEIGKEGNLNLSKCSFIENSRLEEFRNKILKNDDILMALTGATLGKICCVSGLNRPVLQNYRVGKFVPIESKLNKSYLFHFLSSPIALTQIFGKVNQAAQGNVGKSDIENLKIPLPTLDEQELIGQNLDAILGRNHMVRASRVAAIALQKNLINQIF